MLAAPHRQQTRLGVKYPHQKEHTNPAESPAQARLCPEHRHQSNITPAAFWPLDTRTHSLRPSARVGVTKAKVAAVCGSVSRRVGSHGRPVWSVRLRTAPRVPRWWASRRGGERRGVLPSSGAVNDDDWDAPPAPPARVLQWPSPWPRGPLWRRGDCEDVKDRVDLRTRVSAGLFVDFG